MEVIVTAKDRQAAEANRAAESLLEILAKEVRCLSFILSPIAHLVKRERYPYDIETAVTERFAVRHLCIIVCYYQLRFAAMLERGDKMRKPYWQTASVLICVDFRM